MKKLSFVIVILFVTIILGSNSFASELEGKKMQTKREKAIANLLIGLKSDNQGLRISCAYLLGELKAQNAVIPLMKMMHTETDNGAKIMAALSLYKIGNKRGLYAIKQMIDFDESEYVKKMCSKFYYSYVQNNLNPDLSLADSF